MIRAAGARLWYLPPYSPDLNPIEQAFAKIKHWMRATQKRTVEDAWRHIGTLAASIDPRECAKRFRQNVRCSKPLDLHHHGMMKQAVEHAVAEPNLDFRRGPFVRRCLHSSQDNALYKRQLQRFLLAKMAWLQRVPVRPKSLPDLRPPIVL
jgi:hypothetical protein